MNNRLNRLYSAGPARRQFEFAWGYRNQSGTIVAPTRSEARATLKTLLGVRKLPPGITLRLCASAPPRETSPA